MGADGTGADSNMGIPTHEPAATSPETTVSPNEEILTLVNAYNANTDVSNEEAIKALEGIIAITGPSPSTADFPTQLYNFEVFEVSNTLALQRLAYALELQKAGDFEAARAQYNQVLQAIGVDQQHQTQATDNLRILDVRLGWWTQTNSQLEHSDWQGAKNTLQQLSDSLGIDAKNPQTDKTVGELLNLSEQKLMELDHQLGEPTITPEPTPTTDPMMQPSATPIPTP
jgi:hypothetical protein